MPSLFKMISPELHNRSLRELMRTVPPRQLVPFWSAIFFTFAIIGFSLDVFQRGRYPLPQLMLVIVSSGLLGVAAVYGQINQRQRLVAVVVFAYVLIVAILSRGFPLQQAPDPLRLTLDAGGMFASVCVAYWFFFISSAAPPRGSFARRLRSP